MKPKTLQAIQEAGFLPSDPTRSGLFALIDLAAEGPGISPANFRTHQDYHRAKMAACAAWNRICRLLATARLCGVEDRHLKPLPLPVRVGGRYPWGALRWSAEDQVWVYVAPDDHSEHTHRQAILALLKSAIQSASRESALSMRCGARPIQPE